MTFFFKIKKIIRPNSYVNRLSYNYWFTQIKLFLYLLNIFPKYTYYMGKKIPNFSNNVVTYKLISSGSYELFNIKLINKYLDPDSYFFDVGTNNGIFSIIFNEKLKHKGKIYAFDAMSDIIRLNKKIKKSENYKIIYKNLVFGLPNKVKKFTYNYDKIKFITQRDENLVLNEEKKIFKNSFFGYSSKKKKRTIYFKTTSFDEFITKNKIKKVSFIKVDIDGSEFDFLIGAKKTILKYKPHILIEINIKTKKKYELNEKKIIQQIKQLNFLINKTYIIYSVNNNKLTKKKNFSLVSSNGDFFFKRK